MLIQPPGKKRYRMIIANDRVDHDRLIVHLAGLKATVSVGREARATTIARLRGGYWLLASMCI